MTGQIVCGGPWGGHWLLPQGRWCHGRAQAEEGHDLTQMSMGPFGCMWSRRGGGWEQRGDQVGGKGQVDGTRVGALEMGEGDSFLIDFTDKVSRIC